MTRAVWLVVNLMALGLAIVAGWFAVTAPQIARPTLAPLGEVALPDETPPAPPTPVAPTAGDAGEQLARRGLFAAPDAPAAAPPTALAAPALASADATGQSVVAEASRSAIRDVRAESPIARGFIDTLTPPSADPSGLGAAYREPFDLLTARLAIDAPSVRQFFSWRSMNYESRRADPPPVPEADPAATAAAEVGSETLAQAEQRDGADATPSSNAAGDGTAWGARLVRTEAARPVAVEQTPPSVVAIDVPLSDALLVEAEAEIDGPGVDGSPDQPDLVADADAGSDASAEAVSGVYGADATPADQAASSANAALVAARRALGLDDADSTPTDPSVSLDDRLALAVGPSRVAPPRPREGAEPLAPDEGALEPSTAADPERAQDALATDLGATASASADAAFADPVAVDAVATDSASAETVSTAASSLSESSPIAPETPTALAAVTAADDVASVARTDEPDAFDAAAELAAAGPPNRFAPFVMSRPRRAPRDRLEATVEDAIEDEAVVAGPAEPLDLAPRPSTRPPEDWIATRRIEAAATTLVDRPETDDALAPEPSMILLGVFASRGADRVLLKLPNGAPVRLELGDEIDGWRVQEITDDSVQLRRASQTLLLTLP